MLTASKVLVGLVAIEHVYILVLEMFLWTRPKGLRTFGLTREFAEQSKQLAANQGLYNGFLAAGLAWGLLHPDLAFGHQIQLFFVACVVVAGLYGGLTTKRSILVVQALPGTLALAALLLG
jgi:putative membrane protein